MGNVPWESLPPGLLMLLGALLLPLLRGHLHSAWILALPVISAAHLLLCFADGDVSKLYVFGYELVPVRVDRLSLMWGYVFHLAAFISVIYALHVKDPVENFSSITYSAAAIAAVFAGDMISLFVFWEITAITSVFLIWAGKRRASYAAGMRYLIIQVGSGVLLLSGTILRFSQTGTLSFGAPGEVGVLGLDGVANYLIFAAIGIKAAFPLLHNWLQDAYPEASPSGTVFLSAFTTKLAIYALARGFAGTESLIYIGATMTAFPIFYAVIENDLRRVLAYSLNNQLGYMVVGIGIGSELALNGTASHAFAHILYKGLLFMSMGAVLYRTGTVKGSELGGLYKSMPWTTGFCMVGAAAISAFPLFSGFVSKSMILTAAAEEHHFWVWLILLFASAGVFHHSGIKIPYFAFFAHDSGIRVKEAPFHMLLAMGLAAFFCVALGIAYPLLYGVLPYACDYHPYTTTHVITQLQLLLFSALAFTVLMRTGIYPPELRSVNLDFDYIYRRFLPKVLGAVGAIVRSVNGAIRKTTLDALYSAINSMSQIFGEQGTFGRTWSTSAMAVWAAILLGFFLLLYYF